MGSITISAGVGILLAVAAGLVTLKNAWDIIKVVLHPEADLRKTVAENSKNIADNKIRLDALERTLDYEQSENSEFRTVMCQAMQAHFDHVLSGNDVEHIRQARNKLNDYLSNNRR